MQQSHLVDRIIRDFVRDMTVVGGLSGASAAVPGVGTVARVSVGITAETAVLMERAAFMILAVADVYGHDLGDVQVRRFAILRVLGMWAGIADGLTGVAATMGSGLGTRATRAIPMSAINAFNKKMGKRILLKWASKTGTVRLGSVLPFGIGAGLGAGGNYAMATGLARAARSEFSPIPVDDKPGRSGRWFNRPTTTPGPRDPASNEPQPPIEGEPSRG